MMSRFEFLVFLAMALDLTVFAVDGVVEGYFMHRPPGVIAIGAVAFMGLLAFIILWVFIVEAIRCTRWHRDY